MVEPRLAAMHEGLRAEWDDDVEGSAHFGAKKVRWRDAHDRDRRAIERQRPADGVRRTAEVPLPEAVIYDRDGAVRSSAARIVCIRERAATPCRYVQDLEK